MKRTTGWLKLHSLLMAIAIFASALAGGSPSATALNFPEPDRDDAGHLSFFRQVIPLLYGRKPKGSLEVQVFADIANLLNDREAVLRVMMEDPEFREHWAAVLIDNLRIQRTDIRRLHDPCFGDFLLEEANGDPKITTSPAIYVRAVTPDGQPSSNISGPFGVVDLVHSAIELDDIFPLYRAYLFIMAAQVGREFIDPEQKAGTVAEIFCRCLYEPATHVYGMSQVPAFRHKWQHLGPALSALRRHRRDHVQRRDELSGHGAR